MRRVLLIPMLCSSVWLHAACPPTQSLPAMDVLYGFDVSGFTRFKQQDKFGVIDAQGKVRIPAIYAEMDVALFEERVAVVRDGKIGFVDMDGQEIGAFAYEDVRPFHDGYAAIKRDGLWGYMDRAGKEIIAPQYEKAGDFSEGQAAVKQGGRWQWIDAQGKTLASIAGAYGGVSGLAGGLALVEKDWEFGYINAQGKEVIPLQYLVKDGAESVLYPFRENAEGLWGAWDKAGNIAITPRYDAFFPFADGLAQVWKDRKIGFINTAGEEIIPLRYDNAHSFTSGRGWGQREGTWRLLDTDGTELRTVAYADVRPFTGEFASVQDSEKRVGFINRDGEEIIAPQYDWINGLRDGIAVVQKDGKWQIITMQGCVIASQ